MPKPKFDPFDLDSILGPPPALHGRDLEEFYGLYQLLCDDLKPQGFSEHIEVRFCGEKLLEMQGLKRRIVDLIASAEFASLLSLLPPADRYEDLETAKNYYSENSQTREKAQAYVKRLEITRAEIRANAVHLRHETLALLERMISERETAWRRTTKHFRKMDKKAPAQGADRRLAKSSDLPSPKDGWNEAPPARAEVTRKAGNHPGTATGWQSAHCQKSN